ncbi:MAG: DUF58 domain-containing protein, partial [Mariprofundaceae bacterium]|nr:DUF58 domain-containing protein [Mariprofundaceae bacterium]
MTAALQPLLEPAEIKRLIQQAGHANPRTARPSQQHAAFGEQPSSQLGSGMDFADRRPYQPGDDPRFIDWRASARSAQTLIRRYHSEISHPGCIVIDRRASMAYGTRKRLKVTQAVRAGITLGARMLHCGTQLAMLLLEHPEHWHPPQSGLASLQHAAGIAARACPPTDEGAPGHHWNHIGHGLIDRLPQGSQLVLISDFAALDSSARKVLRLLGQHFDCHAVHIIDASEQALPQASPLMLHWSGRSLSVSGRQSQRQALRLSLQQRQQQLQDWFGRARCHYTLLPA